MDNNAFSPSMLAQEMSQSSFNRSQAFKPSLGGQRGAVAGTAANPSPSPIPSMPGSPSAQRAVGDTRPRYQTGQYNAGSWGDKNARVNAGIYEEGTVGAENARVNRTGISVGPDVYFDVPTTALQRPQNGSPKRTPLKKLPTSAPTNSGGIITRGGTVLKYGPSDAANLNPMRPNQGGTITKGGQTFKYGPSATEYELDTPDVDVNAPTTDAAPQTESRNPLSGTSNQQVQGTTQPVNPGSALGFSRTGGALQRGQDAVGSNGLFNRRFSSPVAATAYDSYVKKLFG